MGTWTSTYSTVQERWKSGGRRHKFNHLKNVKTQFVHDDVSRKEEEEDWEGVEGRNGGRGGRNGGMGIAEQNLKVGLN